ncbi:MAG: DUF411 domain-containing protein [Caulobacterales bacterium]|nr:DUF411 domain-containing protein [Caulobacterales bacterium]
MVLNPSSFTRRRMAALLSAGLAGACAPKPVAAKAITVYKDPNCGCCGGWVDHLKRAGYSAMVVEPSDLTAIRARHGVPDAVLSCHMAVIDGYFVEGHVPAEDIDRLIRLKPMARGLAVPGMPVGSPGMESPDGQRDPYDVLLIMRDGSSSAFARHS